MPSQNCFMIGMLPWIEFSNYTPIPYAPMNNFYPIIQSDKFFEKYGRKIMPLSITVHHSIAKWLPCEIIFRKVPIIYRFS